MIMLPHPKKDCNKNLKNFQGIFRYFPFPHSCVTAWKLILHVCQNNTHPSVVGKGVHVRSTSCFSYLILFPMVGLCRLCVDSLEVPYETPHPTISSTSHAVSRSTQLEHEVTDFHNHVGYVPSLSAPRLYISYRQVSATFGFDD